MSRDGRAPALAGEWHLAATRAQVTARGGLRVQVGGRWIALVLWQGRVHAIDDRCPHRGASMAEGIVEAGTIACLEHGWEYDLVTGQGKRPWEGCLETFELDQRGDELWVRVTPRARPAWAAAED